MSAIKPARILTALPQIALRGLALGRPGAKQETLDEAKSLLAQGLGVNKVSKQLGLGHGTVTQLKKEMTAVAA